MNVKAEHALAFLAAAVARVSEVAEALLAKPLGSTRAGGGFSGSAPVIGCRGAVGRRPPRGPPPPPPSG